MKEAFILLFAFYALNVVSTSARYLGVKGFNKVDAGDGDNEEHFLGAGGGDFFTLTDNRGGSQIISGELAITAFFLIVIFFVVLIAIMICACGNKDDTDVLEDSNSLGNGTTSTGAAVKSQGSKLQIHIGDCEEKRKWLPQRDSSPGKLSRCPLCGELSRRDSGHRRACSRKNEDFLRRLRRHPTATCPGCSRNLALFCSPATNRHFLCANPECDVFFL